MEDIEKIFEYFGIEFTSTESWISSRCPIHGGDNPSALTIYHRQQFPVYRCWTNHCHEYFGGSLKSLVRGLLSHSKYGWRKPGDLEASNEELWEFFKNFGYKGVQFSYHNVNENTNSRKKVKQPRYQESRFSVRSLLQIPSPYFLSRGFSPKILDRYDVGDTISTDKFLSRRAIVPIYDINYTLRGFTGRSYFEKCPSCKFFHPPDSKCYRRPKWKHSKKLKTGYNLYNLNLAKYEIARTRTVILVESTGNVWRLEEAGIHNSVGIFGSSISNEQISLLQHLKVLCIISLFDNDSAGEAATNRIKSKFGSSYSIYPLSFNKSDIGEMTVEEINSELKPKINKIIGVYA